MLKLSPEQVSPFVARDRRIFVSRLADLLASGGEAADIGRAELEQRIGPLVDEAARYGLLTERQAAAFVVTAWTLGEDVVAQYPPVREALNATNVTADIKAAWLRQWTEGMFDRLKETLQ